MTCCSACSHDTSFAVRRASGNALVCGLGCVFGLMGKHFECRNAQEFLEQCSQREERRKKRRRCKASVKEWESPEAMGCGS